LTSCETTQAVSQTEISRITLEKISRGSQFKIEIDKQEVSLDSNGLDGEEAVIGNTNPEEWVKINKLIKKLDLDDMINWRSPTTERFYDGARITTIRIEKDGKIYKSQTFDEGNPPAQLKDLYNYLESLVNQ